MGSFLLGRGLPCYHYHAIKARNLEKLGGRHEAIVAFSGEHEHGGWFVDNPEFKPSLDTRCSASPTSRHVGIW